MKREEHNSRSQREPRRYRKTTFIAWIIIFGVCWYNPHASSIQNIAIWLGALLFIIPLFRILIFEPRNLISAVIPNRAHHQWTFNYWNEPEQRKTFPYLTCLMAVPYIVVLAASVERASWKWLVMCGLTVTNAFSGEMVFGRIPMLVVWTVCLMLFDKNVTYSLRFLGASACLTHFFFICNMLSDWLFIECDDDCTFETMEYYACSAFAVVMFMLVWYTGYTSEIEKDVMSQSAMVGITCGCFYVPLLFFQSLQRRDQKMLLSEKAYSIATFIYGLIIVPILTHRRRKAKLPSKSQTVPAMQPPTANSAPRNRRTSLIPPPWNRTIAKSGRRFMSRLFEPDENIPPEEVMDNIDEEEFEIAMANKEQEAERNNDKKYIDARSIFKKIIPRR